MNEFNIDVQPVLNTVREEIQYALNLDGLQLLLVKVVLYFFYLFCYIFLPVALSPILLTIKQFIFSDNGVLIFICCSLVAKSCLTPLRSHGL